MTVGAKQTWKFKVRPTIIDGPIARVELHDGSFAIIDAEFVDLIAPWNWMAWQTSGGGIIVRRNANPGYVVMANIVQPIPPGFFCNDHRNGDPRDNRLQNLRPATRRQNALNQARHGKGEFRGVAMHGGKWRARITTEEGRITLGRFETAGAAALAYDEAARAAFGEFAALNFPASKERQG